jgi:hypothetical protein
MLATLSFIYINTYFVLHVLPIATPSIATLISYVARVPSNTFLYI